jgi:hypothetical protein
VFCFHVEQTRHIAAYLLGRSLYQSGGSQGAVE